MGVGVGLGGMLEGRDASADMVGEAAPSSAGSSISSVGGGLGIEVSARGGGVASGVWVWLEMLQPARSSNQAANTTTSRREEAILAVPVHWPGGAVIIQASPPERGFRLDVNILPASGIAQITRKTTPE